MIVNIHETETQFTELISKFQEGEKIIIAQNGKPILQFAPIGQPHPSRKLGFFNCYVDMSSFDDPIEGMEEYE